MNVTMVPDGEFRLECTSATEQFRPISGWSSVLEALSFVNVQLLLVQATGNFQTRLGIQSASSIQAASAPSAIGTDPGQITGVGLSNAKVYRFDPNAANNGDIDNGATLFRVGILYSLSSGTLGQGSVRWQSLAWR